MGNAIGAPCCFQVQNPNFNHSSSLLVKLVFWEGTTRTLRGQKHIAGEIMFEFPDMMVCHADSFFIGHPVPALGIDDHLMPGQTYFVLPIDRFACNVLTASSLAALASCPNNRSPIKFGQCPFEYIKGSNGRALIKQSRHTRRLTVSSSFFCGPHKTKQKLGKGQKNACVGGGCERRVGMQQIVRLRWGTNTDKNKVPRSRGLEAGKARREDTIVREKGPRHVHRPAVET
ncbi:DUF4228 domain protein [Senna tora]|uniref:DUF4228 domain protein n=1 Tax=Senna tora TaxID=362788 RepID=A0A834W9T9_9FABA|nr:DUF4228 domain protein [Senna tora]